MICVGGAWGRPGSVRGVGCGCVGVDLCRGCGGLWAAARGGGSAGPGAVVGSLLCLVGLPGLLVALPVVGAWPGIVAAWAAPAAVGPSPGLASSPCA